MANLLATIVLLFIAVFIINLFPFGKDFLGGITDSFNEKKENVVEEYEKVKGTVDDITEKVTETKEKVEGVVETVSDVVDKTSDAIDTANEFLGGEEGEGEGEEEPAEEEEEQEPWRTSDPELDPSIEAGRSNYNFADPGPDGLAEAHLHADIKPWIEWGNSVQDETTKDERIAALAITELGRQILDILGYEYEYSEE